MLQFIRKLFAKEDVDVVLPKEVIPFSELPAWIEKHTSQTNKTVSDQANPLFEKLDDILFAVQGNITKLEHAALRNKNISSRELEIMKGNRTSYVLKTKLFLAPLSSFSEKEKKTYDDIKEFVQKYTAQLQPYHDTTLKPYAVLQHFFANEAYAIAKNIKEIDEIIKQLHGLLQKQSVESIASLKQQMQALREKCDEERKLTKEREALQQEHGRLVELEKQNLEKLEKIEKTEGYQKYLALVAKAKESEKKCSAHLDSLKHSFSVLDKAIRKYGKLFPEKEAVLNTFLENPFDALQHDAATMSSETSVQPYAITTLLQSIKEQLIADALDMKDDKKEKALQELHMLTQEYFENFLKKQHDYEEEKKQDDALCSSDFANQQYKEAEYMYCTYKEKAAAVEKECKKTEDSIHALAISERCRQLQEDVVTCTKRDVEIVFT
jgi:hypothetical protein